MRAELTHRYRKAKKEVGEQLEGKDRYSDMGILLRVVRQARPGEAGEVTLRDRPPVVVLREIPYGGMVDTQVSPPELVGPSRNPVVWYCDEVAEPLILHGDDLPLNLLVEGAMRAGKTTAGGMWIGFRALESTGSDGEWGVTAPTTSRVGVVKRAIMDLFPFHWWTWKERDSVFYLRNGVRIRLISTHVASEAEGSQIQGFDWLGSLNDEIQDCLHADGDIEARGSDAPGGKPKRFVTATVKDSSAYRTWKTRILQSGFWKLFRKAGTSNPFIPDSFWEKLRGTLTPQEYARKAEAKDVPSELRVYYRFDRVENLRPVPILGGRDVTARELARYGPGLRLLLGHDPGRIFNVTTILQAWQVPGTTLCIWWIVGEVTTKRSTKEDHVAAVEAYLLKRWQVLPHEVQVIGDPHTRTAKDDERPHETVATIWRRDRPGARPGFNYAPAAYKPNSTEPAQIPREARLDMMNTLFGTADGLRRLMLACNDRGECAAPKTLEALEELETDEAGYAERDKKDEHDKTHWPASTGYALWLLEYPRLEESRRIA